MIEADEMQSNDATDAVRLKTRSGFAVNVAQAGPDDKDELREFFRHVSPEDLRFRFLETVKQVDEAVLKRMVEGVSDVTFLARIVPQGTLIAAATLSVAGDHDKAEVAMSTSSAWKNKGVSWTLLEHVLAYAKARGFTAVSSLESADNREAIALEREMGFIARLNSAEAGEVLASKNL
jgi:acetyltransferase